MGVTIGKDLSGTGGGRRRLGVALAAVAVLAAALSGAASASAADAARPATATSPAARVVRPTLVTGDGPAAARACPKAPAPPAYSSRYKLDGQVWNAADPIDWVLDTRNLPAAGVAARVADIRRALADAAAETHFDFVYRGTVTRVRTAPPYFLLQFAYVTSFSGADAHDLGQETTRYLEGSRLQTVDGDITLRSSLATGFGGYSAVDPADSAEGDVLLHEIGAVLGLANVTTPDPGVVMQPVASAHAYYASYQAGDRYGLWKIGAAEGCARFPD